MDVNNLRFRGNLDIGDKTITVYNYIGGLKLRVSEKLKFFIACAIPKNNILIIFPEFNELSSDAKNFILLHEIAHLKGIMDESKADEYAVKETSIESFRKAVQESQVIRKQLSIKMGIPMSQERKNRQQYV